MPENLGDLLLNVKGRNTRFFRFQFSAPGVRIVK